MDETLKRNTLDVIPLGQEGRSSARYEGKSLSESTFMEHHCLNSILSLRSQSPSDVNESDYSLEESVEAKPRPICLCFTEEKLATS